MPIQTAIDSISNSQGSPFGFKNRIINGGMVIDQRNAGASVTSPNGYQTVDRWKYYISTGNKFNAQQVTDAPDGFTNSLRITSSSAYSVSSSDFFSLVQAIEGYNFADFAFGTTSAKPVTISFWVKSSLTGTFGGTVINNARNRQYLFTYTINQANTWEYETITIPGDNTGTWLKDNGQGFLLEFGLGAGSSSSAAATGAWTASGAYTVTGAVSIVGTNAATWQITGVQVEKGTQATSFDYRPYTTELQLCQRYCYVMRSASTLSQVGFSSAQSTTSAFLGIYLPVTPRTNPTGITASSGNCLNSYAANSNVPTTVIAIPSGWTFAGNFVTMQLTTAGSLVAGQVSPTYFNSATASIEFTGMEL